METLEQGPERQAPSRRTFIVPFIGLLVIGALVAAGLVIDARWRAAAATSLTIAFDQTVTAIENGERRVQLVAEYDQGGATSRDDARQAAIESSALIAERRTAVDAVLLLPWHADLRNAQAQAGVWLDLRATGLNSFAAQGEARYPPRGELNDARAALVRAFSALD